MINENKKGKDWRHPNPHRRRVYCFLVSSKILTVWYKLTRGFSVLCSVNTRPTFMNRGQFSTEPSYCHLVFLINFFTRPQHSGTNLTFRHDFNFPARLQLSGKRWTFRHDFNFPERLSLVCYSTVPTSVYLKIECHLVQVLWAIGYGGTLTVTLFLC